jgi:hypothetical protein
MCHRKPFKKKINNQWWGWWVGGNISSKAFGISFADRPKAKSLKQYEEEEEEE